jgi:Ca2+-binding EF-hand superfamily protein
MKKLLAFAALGATAYLVAAPNAATERFKKYDHNGDGKLTPDELPMPGIFEKLDLNKDGVVTPEEAREAFRGAMKSTAESVESGTPLEKVFSYLDRDHDGKLGSDELTNAAYREKLDSNKDGFVTLEEARSVIGNIVPRSMMKGVPQDSPPAPVVDDTVKEQPQLLKPTEHGIGRMMPDMALKDRAGKAIHLGGKTTVLALFSSSCPLSNKFGPELARIEKDCAKNGIAFMLVNAAPGDSADEVQKYASTYQLGAPIIHDNSKALLSALQATATTETFVLDAARTMLYRGAISDQYGLGYAKETASRNYLRDALEAIGRGLPVKFAATTAPGCALDLQSQPTVTSLTYQKDIARILQANCVECHHKDGLAPFALETLADVTEHAGMIKKQINRGAMPPWFAAPAASEHDNPWANDRSLSSKDKADLLAWLDSDRAAGDAKDAPIARQFPDAWSVGKPDYIVQLPKPVSIKAEGTMPYQFVVAETTLTEDKWVQGYEIVPTDRSVVHHVIVNVHEGKGKLVRDREEGIGGYWAAYVPGNASKMYPSGFARKLPAGARISFQIHYTPSGKATQDQLRMGLFFAKEPPRYAVQTVSIADTKLNIPPGEANHIETTSKTLPTDVNVMAYVAHMHVRGKSFKYEVTLPDGRQETLLDIPHYDFNWQLRYDYKQPRTLPRGSTVKVTAVYDNSANNPANPDPTKTVHWGQQTYDEMMIGYVETFTALPAKSVVMQ